MSKQSEEYEEEEIEEYEEIEVVEEEEEESDEEPVPPPAKLAAPSATTSAPAPAPAPPVANKQQQPPPQATSSTQQQPVRPVVVAPVAPQTTKQPTTQQPTSTVTAATPLRAATGPTAPATPAQQQQQQQASSPPPKSNPPTATAASPTATKPTPAPAVAKTAPSVTVVAPVSTYEAETDEDEEVEYVVEEIEEVEEVSELEDSDGEAYGGSPWRGSPSATINGESSAIAAGGYDEEAERRKLPLLRFETVQWRPSSKEEITTVYLTNRYMLVGTSQGSVMVLDVEGKALLNRVQVSEHAVSDISADERSDFMAACDSEGNIIVQNLDEAKDCYRNNFRKPVKCISLHPGYSSLDDRPFILGMDGGLQLSTKGRFIGTRSTKTLLEGSKFYSLAWVGGGGTGGPSAAASSISVIAVAVDGSIRLIDYSTKTVFQTFPKMNSNVPIHQYRCCLTWNGAHTLHASWGDWVTCIQVHRKPVEAIFQGDLRSNLAATVQSGFLTTLWTDRSEDVRVCGIAPFTEDRILMLVGVLGRCEGMIANVEVHVSQRLTGSAEFRGRQSLVPHHATRYLMAFQPASSYSPNEFFIISPDIIIKAVPCNDNDHVNHYIVNNLFKEAFEFAKAANTANVYAVADRYLEHLLANEKEGGWAVAATKMADICGRDKARWESFILRFESKGKAYMLTKYLPKATDVAAPVKLDPHLYEIVLNSCAHSDLAALKDGLKWFHGIFRPEGIVAVCSKRFLDVCNDKERGRPYSFNELQQLADIYGELLGLEGRFVDALDVLMKVNAVDSVFGFIKKHSLFEKAAGMLPQLFKINANETLLLLNSHANFPTKDPLHPEAVLKALDMHPQLLYAYVSMLPKHSGAYNSLSRNHAQRMAQLYIDLDRRSLLPFLKEYAPFLSDSKSLLDTCRHNKLVEEQAYLMTRMGRIDDGLKILVQDMKNVRKAVDVIKDFPQDSDQEFLFEKIVGLVKQLQSSNELLVDKDQKTRKYITHTVDASDSWESIATRYDYTVSDLMSENLDEASISKITAKSLLIPFYGEGTTCEVPHSVNHGSTSSSVTNRGHGSSGGGDTWGSIATFYHNVSVSTLLQANASILPRNEPLFIPHGGKVVVPYTTSDGLVPITTSTPKPSAGSKSKTSMQREASMQAEDRSTLHDPLPGETWEALSKRFNNINVLELMKANPNALAGSRIPMEVKTILIPLPVLGEGAGRHTLHAVTTGETWLQVVLFYNPHLKSIVSKPSPAAVAAFTLMRSNPTAAVTSKITPGAKLTVPINLYASLFKAVSDPSICEDTAINPVYLLREIPDGYPLPAVGTHLSKIAASRQRQKDMRDMMMGALYGDITVMQSKMRWERSKPMRIDPRTIGAAAAGPIVPATDSASSGGASTINNLLRKAASKLPGIGHHSAGGGFTISQSRPEATASLVCAHCKHHFSETGTPMIVFNCRHAYHARCVVDYLIQTDAIRPDHLTGGKIDNPMSFLLNPKRYLKVMPKKTVPHCKQCFSTLQEQEAEQN